MLMVAGCALVSSVVMSRRIGESPSSAAFAVITSASGYVRVEGDVRHPGIYAVSDNSMTVDVIKMAGPVRSLSRLRDDKTVARPARRGDVIRITFDGEGKGDVGYGTMSTVERLALGLPLDINAMTEADFDYLPGVGPVLARRIVMYRQKNGGYMAERDLQNVDGVGYRTYGRLLRVLQPADNAKKIK